MPVGFLPRLSIGFHFHYLVFISDQKSSFIVKLIFLRNLGFKITIILCYIVSVKCFNLCNSRGINILIIHLMHKLLVPTIEKLWRVYSETILNFLKIK